MINLIIADDHMLFVEGLRSLLKDEADMHILDVANDGRELLSFLHSVQPDLVLLDINMPKLNGLDAARYIRQSFNSLKIIMLSTYNDEHLIEKSKALGVNGYLLKTTSKDELLQTIRLVAAGQACFPYRIPKAVNEFGDHTFLRQFNLTKREVEVLRFLKKEYTNQQIADEFVLSIYTVETHRKNIMQKLHLKSTLALHKFLAEQNFL
jgi:two-component system nitrate/nitrite response regulator NarL